MTTNNLGIYIHVPFCLSKCRYCGFYSKADGSKEAMEQYLNNVIEDVVSYGEEYSHRTFIVDTVFFGGGTPSILPKEYIGEILDTLRRYFEFSNDCEITLESNPKTLTLESLKAYKSYGINRISMGAQSFDNSMLRFLDRAHDEGDIEDGIRLIREAGFDNINIDLMFGLPNQSLETFEDTLQKAILLKPEHLSVYSLQLEEGTELFNMFQRGEFDQLPDEEDRAMYHKAMEVLKDDGYEHYEISNWAKGGKYCRHNLKYWDFSQYLGIGPSASSFVDGCRFTDGELPEYYENTLEDNCAEMVFTAFRTKWGLDKNRFKSILGVDFDQVFADRMNQLNDFKDLGYVQIDEDKIVLTKKGLDIANKIMAIFA